jgi:tryptophanyl-tRNA synthetase
MIPVNPNKDHHRQACPVFDRFLKEIFPCPETRRHFQHHMARLISGRSHQFKVSLSEKNKQAIELIVSARSKEEAIDQALTDPETKKAFGNIRPFCCFAEPMLDPLLEAYLDQRTHITLSWSLQDEPER